MRTLRVITGRIFLMVSAVVTGGTAPGNNGIITEDSLGYITSELDEILITET